MSYVDELSLLKNNTLNRQFKYKFDMCQCCTKERKFEIDHITPLSGGGANEMSNLQVLCKACHLITTSNEHESCQYV
jgi:5-methylcytosine-specific restriction endonuclease McrA